ncbi:MAG: DNA translocase FtsK 4TM domain-containing protein [Parvularculales bacterium]
MAHFLRARMQEGAGLILIGTGLAGLAALISWNSTDPSFNRATSHDALNWLGNHGAWMADASFHILGLAAFLLPLVLMRWGWLILCHRTPPGALWRVPVMLVVFVSTALAFEQLPTPGLWPLTTGLGGFVGYFSTNILVEDVIYPPLSLLDLSFLTPAGLDRTLSIFVAVMAASISLWGSPFVLHTTWGSVSEGIARLIDVGAEKWPRFRRGPKSNPISSRRPDLEPGRWRIFWYRLSDSFAGILDRLTRRGDHPKDADFSNSPNTLREPPITSPSSYVEPERVKRPRTPVKPGRRATREAQPNFLFDGNSSYQLPSLNLLTAPKIISHTGLISEEALEQNARLLESVLHDFGVKGDIIGVRPGPVVTLYELEPAAGIKASRVIGLADDIARSMSVISARVAVVPGRNVIGIELPNSRRETVYLRELLGCADYEKTNLQLALTLGKTIDGHPVIADLAHMPHLLIAGTTGSGKSVGINTMILSILYRLTPTQCRLIMIDPKMLELSVYDNIPHLLTPVVTEPKKAVVALKWAVREMEERYRKMSRIGVRNMESYNARVAELGEGEVFRRSVQTGFDRETGQPIYEEEEIVLTSMPYIVIVVDEMADLMMVAGRDIEAAVQRLAQMARAAGLHIITATQRPSVDVITGTIKANFPTRISFQVTSKIDSRTILGEQGAEQLLGQGDMLYMAGGGRLTRVHGPFVSDNEVEKVVNFLKKQGAPDYLESVTSASEDSDEVMINEGGNTPSTDESLYDQAVAVVIRDRRVSTSYLQRRLQIGYNRAARLVESMEEQGVVSGPNHAGKREVLAPEQGES